MAKHSNLSTIAVRVVAGGAVLVAGACTTTMNWQFGHGLASSELDGHILGTFSVALDVCKWFALGLAALAWRAGAYLRAAAGLAVWLVAVAYSGAAAIGFSALNRDFVVAERSAETSRIERARNTLKEASAELEAAKTNKRWSGTSACTDATAAQSIEFCNRVAELNARVSEASAVLDRGTTKEADPQAALIARITGYDVGSVKIGLASALAVVAEVVSAFGLFAVMAPPTKQPSPERAKAKKRRKPAKRTAKVLPFARVVP